jgi:tetratricopeptide (TPR) repeat protein
MADVQQATPYDFNVLEARAKELVASNRHADAIKIYLFMADGDASLDAGYLAELIGECYEALGDLHAAKYWYGRAIEENPHVRIGSVKAHDRLKAVSIDHLLRPQA